MATEWWLTLAFGTGGGNPDDEAESTSAAGTAPIAAAPTPSRQYRGADSRPPSPQAAPSPGQDA